MSKHTSGSDITPEQAFEAIMAEAMTTVAAHGGQHGVYLNNLAAIVRPTCAQAPRLLEALKGLDEAYCRALMPLTKQERHEDRLRLIEARAAIKAAKGDSHE